MHGTPTRANGPTSGGVTAPSGPEASLRYLLGRLAVIESRVREEVARRRGGDAEGDDRFRGLYVSDARVDALLAAGPPAPVAASPKQQEQAAAVEAYGDTAEAQGATLRLRRLAADAGLAPLDVELLLVAMAPEVDPRFESLYGYLNDDVSRRRASLGVGLRLCGVDLRSATARGRVASGAPLVRSGLLEVEDPDRPELSRLLRVPERVVGHLLGDDTPDGRVRDLLGAAPAVQGPSTDQLVRALVAGTVRAYVRDPRGSGAESVAAGALAAVGLSCLFVELARLDGFDDVAAIARVAAREARLRGAGLVVGPIDVMAAEHPAGVRAFAEAEAITILTGREAWDPRWSREVPLLLVADRPGRTQQQALWHAELDGELAADVDPVAATAMFRLSPQQVRRAARAARQQAAAAGTPVDLSLLHAGVRAQNAAGLQRLARRIEPEARWDELVLPPAVEAQLRELPMRWRQRDRVLREWGMGGGPGRGSGVSALFAGGSGTGKTMSAEVIAADLGLDLYVVDLSTVVDKYIGETSKNLERIFDEADQVNGVLLFDEADALFGKRSAVSDAKDRHANVEVAYLLQRMESFDGVAILTTNLAANLDDAFLRRLDAIIDFPSPDEPQRLRLWQAKLGDVVPREDDLDLDFLANRFKLSGSEIRNIVLSAAYHAADAQRSVRMVDLVRATIREHRKIGRHLTASDLGEYATLLEEGR
ncbi:MAG TPA: ATP-binding protein [Egicoccus sp.]|nr:ATP-binding protein [Egicoccus sp.]HSK24916.1 ATP-binding protein [Egicoccus sp.]